MSAKQIHELEQMMAAVATMAAVTARYYLQLRAEGIPEPQALGLTAHHQAELVRSALGNKPQEDE